MLEELSAGHDPVLQFLLALVGKRINLSQLSVVASGRYLIE